MLKALAAGSAQERLREDGNDYSLKSPFLHPSASIIVVFERLSNFVFDWI